MCIRYHRKTNACKGIQKDGNNVNYQTYHNVLFNKHKDQVLNKGFCYVDGYMKTYEQSKKGLSFAYHKRIVCDDGITTKPLTCFIKIDNILDKLLKKKKRNR